MGKEGDPVESRPEVEESAPGSQPDQTQESHHPIAHNQTTSGEEIPQPGEKNSTECRRAIQSTRRKTATAGLNGPLGSIHS